MRLIDIEQFEKYGNCEIHFNYNDDTQTCEAIDTRAIKTVELTNEETKTEDT